LFLGDKLWQTETRRTPGEGGCGRGLSLQHVITDRALCLVSIGHPQLADTSAVAEVGRVGPGEDMVPFCTGHVGTRWTAGKGNIDTPIAKTKRNRV